MGEAITNVVNRMVYGGRGAQIGCHSGKRDAFEFDMSNSHGAISSVRHALVPKIFLFVFVLVEIRLSFQVV